MDIGKPINPALTLRENSLLHQFMVPVLIRNGLRVGLGFNIKGRACMTPQVDAYPNRRQPSYLGVDMCLRLERCVHPSIGVVLCSFLSFGVG